jgi:hypothetical protein
VTHGIACLRFPSSKVGSRLRDPTFFSLPQRVVDNRFLCAILSAETGSAQHH